MLINPFKILLKLEHNNRRFLQTYVHLCARLDCKSLNLLQKNMRLQLFIF